MINQTLSHYLVLEQIGSGGMGVVYRAHDQQLERDVAIKVLPQGSLADDAAVRKFRKEALSLARLNHPNVATVHEFGTQDGVNFLVTEYISGITLDSKLARGALPEREVIALGTQLAEGLAAAHDQGIAHRDLKPANLRLTPDRRLKILDFGLAQFVAHASELGLTNTLTQSMEVSGTLPYMAPEQLRGEPADARADIWSAGAVLYEMATGKLPFPQSNTPLLIDAILNHSPELPSRITPAVSSGLQQVLLKALEKDPAKRHQSARELGLDLERLRTGTLPVTKSQPVRPGQFLAAGTILLVVLFVCAYFLLRRSRERSVASPVGRKSVAVLGFKNLAGKPEVAWLSTALSEMLTTELAQGNQLRTVPGESVAQMRRSLSLPETDSFAQETLNRIRENLGTDEIVVGSFVPLASDEIRLDLRLQDTRAGETQAAVSEKGSISQIDELVARAGAQLRAKLGVAGLSDAESAAVRATMPSNPEAARLYSEGLEKLRLFDALAARPLLEKAAALAPDHAPVHSALAEAWSRLGYDEKAAEQAKLAMNLSAPFSREERLVIEGQYQESTKDWSGAAVSYGSLWKFFPDQADYGLLLARAQNKAGHSNDALATLAQLRKLPASKGLTARIDFAEATVEGGGDDFKLQQAAAERSAQEGTAIGANLLVAEALRVEADAWLRMGQPGKSEPLLSQARNLYAAAGDRGGAAVCTLLAGDRLYDKGDFEGARTKFEEALSVFRETGDRRRTRVTLERIGNSLLDQGKLLLAKGYYEQDLQIDLDLKDDVELSSDYGNIANALDGLGDLAGARKMQEKSLVFFRKGPDRRGTAATLGNLGNVLMELGEPEQARPYYEQALSIMREISYGAGEPYPTAGLGDVLLMEADLAGARKQYDQALKLTKEAHEDEYSAVIQVGLALVALEEGRFADCETLSRASIATFDKDNVPDNGAWARSVLVRDFLEQGKTAEAERLAKEAILLSEKTASQSPKFEAALADSMVKAKLGRIAEAGKELQPLINTSQRLGYRYYEYQSRLALAEDDLHSNSSDAATRIAIIEKEAKAHGLLLVAKHARKLLQDK